MNETIKIKMMDYFFYMQEFDDEWISQKHNKAKFLEEKKYTSMALYFKSCLSPRQSSYTETKFVSSNCYTVAIAIQKTLMSVILNITMCLAPQPGK